MLKIFEALAEGGVIRLPAGVSPSAHCVVTILENDLESLREQAAWTIPQAKQERMSELLLKNREGSLAEGEHEELDALAEEFDRETLRKGWALAALTSVNGNSQNG
jgi:hypothetical protein